MNFQTWLAYTSIAFVNIITPGAAVMLAVTTSVRSGLSGALFTSLGNVSGLFILASLSALGVGAFVMT
jgi:homoserine/homoserine lactone efflux protein